MLVVVLFLLQICACGPLFAWGSYGHQVAAALAERHLTPEAKAQVLELLGPETTLADVSDWADGVAREKRSTGKWHVLLMPKGRASYKAENDCPQGGCLVSAVEEFTATLSDRSRPLEERAQALKFLAHFAADLHQPLHCGYREDRGGETVKVNFRGRPTTLHEVWDSGILARDQMPYQNYVDILAKRISPQDIEVTQKGEVLDWIFESRTLLQDYVYTYDSKKPLDYEYLDRALAVVDRQLVRAGLRAAALINAALSPE